MEMPVQSSSSKMERGEEGGGGEWFTGLANNRPMPDPPFPFLPIPILLYSPGLCDDKSSLTDQLTSFPPDLCLLTYIYPYKYEIFSSNYLSLMEKKTINNSTECKKCFFLCGKGWEDRVHCM